MYTKPIILKCLVFFVFIMIIMCDCEGSGGRRTKFGRKINSASKFSSSNLLNNLNKNDSSRDAARDFGSIFSLGKVLNFFPVGGERECQPEGFNVAKAGICLNPYDCRQRDGRAAGDCAHGLGVCCVFEVSCGGVVQNNLTYFLSPGFPELWSGDKNCDITIEKTHAGITQLKIDFIHFNIGQPNRTTGKCDEDAMVLGEGDSKFTLCGQNHGQHVYYTMSSQSETREDGDLPNTKATKLSMVMRATETPRLWLLRLAQLPLAQSAPHDCLQYHTDNNGTIKTFNFASNGRHLAGQEYKSCVRRNAGFCAIRYIPCGERSFRIDGDRTGPITYGGSGTVVYGQGGYTPLTPSSTIRPSTISSMAMDEQANANETMPVNEMPSPSDPENDEIEGSGSDPMIGAPTPAPANTNNNNGIWSYMIPSWLWQRSGRAARRWSPYFQHFNSISDYRFQYHGYGNFGSSLYSYGRIRCQDRITIPCENEYFVSSSSLGAGVCDPHHCGASLCPAGRPEPCRVESSITPFAVSVHFGPPTPKSSPEDNIGACLRYIQLPCTS